MATPFTRGARAYVNRHVLEADRCGVTVYDMNNLDDEATRGSFCALSGLEEEHVVRIGQSIPEEMCVGLVGGVDRMVWFNDADDPAIDYVGSFCRAFRPWDIRTWNMVDGTVPSHPTDEPYRVDHGPNWAKNSCALDSVLFCALLLNAGRTQIDQLNNVDHGLCGTAAILLRECVKLPWGLASMEKKMAIRDALRHELTSINPVAFPKYTDQSAMEVMETLFHRLPQLSWTKISARRDCDGIIRVPKGVPAQYLCLLEIMKELYSSTDGTASTVISIMLSAPSKNPHEGFFTCFSKSCQGQHPRLTVTLDRLPPILTVHPGDFDTLKKHKERGFFKPITVRYLTKTGMLEGGYIPIIVMLYTQNSHFVVRWRKGFESLAFTHLMHYDGMADNGKCSVVGEGADVDWFEGLEGSPRITVVFYRHNMEAWRMVDPTSGPELPIDGV